MEKELTSADVRKAYERIKAHIHRTPVLTCTTLDNMTGAKLFFKCENFQKAGVFKIRGATNAVSLLSAEEAARGVATHSSGNHGAAVAMAARRRGIKAYVVMPENSPKVKKQAVAGYGAEIVFCEPCLESRESELAELVKRTGASPVHPYNDRRVIAGQGTAGLELCEDTERLDVVIAPVGGGGLVSGTALAVNGLSPGTEIIAAEPEQADDAYRSFHAGKIILVEHANTIADGLRTSLGSLTFPIIRKYVSDIVTVSEESIVSAMRLIWERMKIVVEPSASVPLAAVLGHASKFSGKRIGVILSGGNVDLDALPWAR
jgi:threonine dehydratase